MNNQPNDIITVEIPLKLASLNEYINLCRGNRYASAKYKKDTEAKIIKYLDSVPKYNNPISIEFIWIEGNKRRDYDNVSFARKFILDALVKAGKLKDDNRKCVVGFTDNFQYADDFKVVLKIKEQR